MGAAGSSCSKLSSTSSVRLSCRCSSSASIGRRQPVDVELVQPFRTGEIFEPMQPEVLERQAGWKHVIDERARRFRDEYLAAVCGAGDPGGAVDIEAEVLVTDECRLAGVQPDAHLNAPSLGPGMRLQSLLRRRRAAAGIQRAAEHDEE